MEAIAVKRYLPALAVPEKLRQRVGYICAVMLAVKLLQLWCPRDSDVLAAVSVGKRALDGELRLVGEHSSYRLSEFVSDNLFVPLVSHRYKPVHCLFREGVNVCLVVVPPAFRCRTAVCIPFRSDSRLFRLYAAV